MDNNSKLSKSTKKSKVTNSGSKKNKTFQKSRMTNADKDGNPSQHTKKKIIQFILKVAQSQRKLQIIKQTLAQVPTFTPASLFHRFDANRKNYILEKDIEDFLTQANIGFNGSQLKTLFGRIDVNQSQTISLQEFQNFILPNQNPKLRYQTVRRPVFVPKPHERLCKQIQFFTGKFFKQIIKQYSELAEINSTLKSSYDFNPEKIFQILSCGQPCITGETIQKFMELNGGDITNQEIGCLIKTIDKNGVAKINPEDFNVFMATMGLKKPHVIFDQLSSIPALKDFTQDYLKGAIKDRQSSLKERYIDNKSYVKGIDQQGHHILGYSRFLDPALNNNKSWLTSSSKKGN